MAESGPKLVNVKHAADRLKASEAHLAKVFAKLNKSGIIAATRGPLGGYSLQKNPDDISFLDVYEIFEAPINLEACPLGKKHCAFGSCIFEGRIHKVSTEIYSILKETRISDLTPGGGRERPGTTKRRHSGD